MLNQRHCLGRINIGIQGIPKTEKDEELSKVIDIFSALDISISSKDVEDWRHIGKGGKNTITRFVNRQDCYETLSRKMDLSKIDNSLLAFQPDVKLYLNENVNPNNQYLGLKCREFKKVTLINQNQVNNEQTAYLNSSDYPSNQNDRKRVGVCL